MTNRHFATVHGLAFKMTGDRDSADDIAQEVFLKVFRSLHQFKRDSKFSTWLYRIAMNTIFSHLKSKQRLHLPAGEISDLVPSSDASAEETLLRSELSTEITKQMQTMKPEYRAAIVLTSFQGLTPGEAAEAVGCSSDTFYWRLNQARNQLRERLADWLKK